MITSREAKEIAEKINVNKKDLTLDQILKHIEELIKNTWTYNREEDIYTIYYVPPNIDSTLLKSAMQTLSKHGYNVTAANYEWKISWK